MLAPSGMPVRVTGSLPPSSSWWYPGVHRLSRLGQVHTVHPVLVVDPVHPNLLVSLLSLGRLGCRESGVSGLLISFTILDLLR